MNVHFSGQFFGTSGYAVHLKSLALATKKLGHRVTIDAPLVDNWEKIVNQEEYDLLSDKESNKDRWCVTVFSPYYAPLKYREEQKLAVFMVFEGDIAPKQWGSIARSERIKIVLTPSQHSKEALLKAGVPENKIFVVPHGFDERYFHPLVQTDAYIKSDDCTFIWNKGWSKGEDDRSGFADVLRAFTEEFKDEPKARLLAHINPTYNGVGWNIGVEIEKLGLPDLGNRKCKITVNNDTFPIDMVAKFYKAGSFYIGTSKADAFNIPVLESMACGLIPIIGSFGGQTDYAGKVGWVVGGELVPVKNSDVNDLSLYEQAKWLKLDHVQLRKVFREAFEMWKNDKEELKRKSEACVKACEGWTWKDSALKLLEVLGKNEENVIVHG